MKMLTPVLRSAIRRGQLADLGKLRNILEQAAYLQDRVCANRLITAT